MAAESFFERWARKERECEFDDDPIGMVRCAGVELPREAGPCLWFDEAESMRRVFELFGTPADWTDNDRARLEAYRVIGSDGAGNPICVEEGAGTVWLLDHEDGFRTRQFVNSSVAQLAECLLAYLGEQDAERFRSAVLSVDGEAMADETFWWHEATLLAEDSD